MCTITTEVSEVKPAVDLAESRCGGTDEALSGANTEREDSEPPTPKKPTLASPKWIKEEEEEDDPLSYLTLLFDLATIDDSDDSESDDDESAPPSPRPKGFDKFYFYAASGRVLYYDSYRNVYFDNGTLIYHGSFDFPLDGLFSPSFHIDGVPYWFDLEGLWSNNVDGTPYRIITWQQSEPTLLDLGQYVDPTSSQTNSIVYQPNLNPTSYYAVNPAQMTMPGADDYRSTPETKTEALTPNVNSSSIEPTLREGAKPLMWSPTSSTWKSPLLASREPSEGPTKPSLFHESQPVMAPIIKEWQEQLVQARKAAAKARPVAKSSKEERRRCPDCNKLFRRPSSLDDHLNVHSGHKPHTCPFTGCKTGFATKSNMKRHFLTHRVGPLERYRPGVTQVSEPYELSPTKKGKAPRATSTYNSKAHHTMRFRIAA
ncbi:unnamed protein product [Rhizoctonia solani]|uniref:C2H2-type domain-containing protein n=1 Tax=Rhizoctonia solani TaxID=456999 RepID=A0A8H3CKV4_9AGAM|nr:unnamed protein product [Rhizoctonia solani]